jgi:hypothetical protein
MNERIEPSNGDLGSKIAIIMCGRLRLAWNEPKRMAPDQHSSKSQQLVRYLYLN